MTSKELKSRLIRSFVQSACESDKDPSERSVTSLINILDFAGQLPEWPEPVEIYCTMSWEHGIVWRSKHGYVEVSTEPDSEINCFRYKTVDGAETFKVEGPLDDGTESRQIEDILKTYLEV